MNLRRALTFVSVGLALCVAACPETGGNGHEEATAPPPDPAMATLEQVEDLLQEQAAAWSRGELEAFTSIYADDALFLSASGLTQGREEILERYRQRYHDPAGMGQLTMEILDARPAACPEDPLSGSAVPGRLGAVTVAARWRLSYPEGSSSADAEGLTLLVFHRRSEGWRIVQDASM